MLYDQSADVLLDDEGHPLLEAGFTATYTLDAEPAGDVRVTESGELRVDEAGNPRVTEGVIFYVSGVDAGATTSRSLTAVTGSVSMSGIAADMSVVKTLVAADRSYSLTGQDALLEYTQTSYDLVADAQSYALAGQQTGLAKVYPALAGAPQSFSITPAYAGTVYEPPPLQLVGYASTTSSVGGNTSVGITSLTTGSTGVGSPIEDGDVIFAVTMANPYGASIDPADYAVTNAGFSTVYQDVVTYNNYSNDVVRIEYLVASTGSIPTTIETYLGPTNSSGCLQVWVIRGLDAAEAATIVKSIWTDAANPVTAIQFTQIALSTDRDFVLAVGSLAASYWYRGLQTPSLPGFDDAHAEATYDTYTMGYHMTGLRSSWAPATATFDPADIDPWFTAPSAAGAQGVLVRMPAGTYARYTLTANTGAFTETGVAATFAHPQRYIHALPRTYVAQGYPVVLPLSHDELVASAQSYTLTGVAASFTRTRAVVASAQSYTLTGVAASFTRSLALPADTQTFTVSGVTADILSGAAITCSVGAIALTNQDADITAQRSASATSRAYVLGGVSAGIAASRVTVGTAQTYAFAGQAAVFERAMISPATPQAYTVSGAGASFTLGKVVVASPAAFALAGTANTMVADGDLPTERGVFGLSGPAAALELYRNVTGTVQTYVMEAQSTTFAHVIPSVGRIAADGQATNYVDSTDMFNAVSGDDVKNSLAGVGEPNSVSD